MLCGFEMDCGLLGSCPVSVITSAIYIIKEYTAVLDLNLGTQSTSVYVQYIVQACIHAYACNAVSTCTIHVC